MKKELRYYQIDAIKALFNELKSDKNSVPYAELITGSGKSLICADIANTGLNAGRRVLIIVPTKELCEQNYKEAVDYCDKAKNIGVCCSKLHRFEINRQLVIGTITSLVKRRYELGKFDLVIIDECHRFSPEKKGIYWKTITALNVSARIIGMTATPYRMDMGLIHDPVPEKKGKSIFTKSVYKSDIKQLISEGYLSHVKDVSGEIHADLEGVPLAGKDYNTEIMGVKFNAIVFDAVKDLRAKFTAYNIKTAIIFASSLDNADCIWFEWNDSKTMRIIHGDMDEHDRKNTIEWLKHGHGCRYIVNVGILTTGFDFTALDCVVLMRATKSIGLYIQMVGRVIRAHNEKEFGYLIDYGTNVERHGPIDNIQIKTKIHADNGKQPVKQCDKCKEYSPINAENCDHCWHLFPESENGDYAMRSNAQVIEAPVKHEISRVKVEKHLSNKDLTPMVKMIFYPLKGNRPVHSEYICLNHIGFAKAKADKKVIEILTDPSFYFNELLEKESGCDVDNFMKAFDDQPEKFKEVKSIIISKEGKYNRLLDWDFK
jgi:DNA repair protein RadD